MTSTITNPIAPADVEDFYADILSGRGDRWRLIEIDKITGTKKKMTGRQLRRQFESHSSDLAVSGLLAKANRLH
jgi:hypothetical protein